ncbi:MAG: hypothetical protein Mars2KO_44530 [Maribacter sp.]
MKRFLLIFVVLAVLSFNPVKDNEIITSGNVLLKQVEELGQSSCTSLTKSRIYLEAYQELYTSHKYVLQDNSEALKKVKELIIQRKCRSFKVPDGYSIIKRITYNGGGGKGKGDGREVDPYVLATFYMDEESKKAFLNQLPKELNDKYFEEFNNIKFNNQELFQQIIDNSINSKLLDQNRFFDWYSQNNKFNLNQNIIRDLKTQSIEFQQN